MARIIRARSFLSIAPREALADAAGLALMCVMIFASFTLPAFF